ncbi:hypothetical protein [Streptomyces sp. NRRL WC-3742]|uniref:hypothetical protein n=1 Tax=Streptomyces sp. NRRL WC-3742 TaxID=1463934 RepID=UPI001F1CA170|nr:hypothetical protein [Streptomyces sp. NRRL WC-3742]
MATPAGNGAPGAAGPARPGGPPTAPGGTGQGTALVVPGGTTATAPAATATPATTPARPPAPRTPVALATGFGARLSHATRTAPGRLRIAGALLATLTIAFGALTAWQLETRAQAADRVVGYSQPLSRDAAEIHRSLADAATTSASGFLLAGAEPKAVRERYEADLRTASRLLSESAARTTSTSPARDTLSELNQQLPVYAGLVETARADNRQGIPLGGAYLRYASEQMQTVLLPAAARLRDIEDKELAKDYAEAESWPSAAYGLALVTLLALVWVQRQLYRRTNRVFNIGLLGATAAILAGGLWLTTTGLTTSSALRRSDHDGATPLRALNSARVDVLSARLSENLHLVARGSTGKYLTQWDEATKRLAGTDGPDVRLAQRKGSIPEAYRIGPAASAKPLEEAIAAYDQWRQRHDVAHALEVDRADYDDALKATVSDTDTTGTADAAFKQADEALERAAKAEQKLFTDAAEGTGNDLRIAAVAAAVLALVAAAAALRGLGRRLAEYR